MPWPVTESITLPVIVPVMPAAGVVYGISRLSASRPVAAMRMRVAIIGKFPPQGSPQRGGLARDNDGCRSKYTGEAASESLKNRAKPHEAAVARLPRIGSAVFPVRSVDREALDGAIRRFGVAGATELIDDTADHEDA